MDRPPIGPHATELDDDEPLFSHRRNHNEATFDITAMIDLVFMLNIFFLVTTVVAAQAEMDLPVVRHCVPTDPDESALISLVAQNPNSVTVFLGDGPQGEGLTDREEQLQAVHRSVEEASRAGKHIILLKAERSVKLRDVKRIGAAAIRDITGMELRMAVIEKE
jgi:biopolymer transport protein ExbD